MCLLENGQESEAGGVDVDGSPILSGKADYQ